VKKTVYAPVNSQSQSWTLRKNLGSGLPDMPVRRTTAALPQARRLLSTTQPILRRIILSIYHFNSFHHFVFDKLVSSRNVILKMYFICVQIAEIPAVQVAVAAVQGPVPVGTPPGEATLGLGSFRGTAVALIFSLADMYCY